MDQESKFKEYREQLHPVFAGYLHDGHVTKRDILAAIFQLFKKGNLRPKFINDRMSDGIEGAYRTQEKPTNPFELGIIHELFGDEEYITALEIGEKIKDDSLKDIIQWNLDSIEKVYITNQKIEVSIGKTSIMTIPTYQVETFKEIHLRTPNFIKDIVKLVLWAGLIYIGAELYKHINIPFYFFVLGIVVPLLIGYLIMRFGTKRMHYDFKYSQVNRAIILKYQELYRYLKNHPLTPHRFTNEFLPFSIAFGLDDSWFTDFGLAEEVELHETPLADWG